MVQVVKEALFAGQVDVVFGSHNIVQGLQFDINWSQGGAYCQKHHMVLETPSDLCK